MESLMDLMVLIGAIIVSVVLSIVGYFLRDLRASLKEDLRDHKADIDKIKHDCARCQANLPRQFVLKEDFVRMSAAIDRKIDLLHDEMRKIVRHFLGPHKNGPGAHGGKG